MCLHSANQVIVDFHQHAIFQFAIFLSARVQLDFAVKGANLLDLCRDKVTLDIVVSDVQLVFLHSSALHPAW